MKFYQAHSGRDKFSKFQISPESLNCNISDKHCQLFFLEGLSRKCLKYSRLNNHSYSVILSSKNDVPQKEWASSVHGSNNCTSAFQTPDNLCTLVCCKNCFVKTSHFSLAKTLQKEKKTYNQLFIRHHCTRTSQTNYL